MTRQIVQSREPRRVGLIGYGAIGQAVARILGGDPDLQLGVLKRSGPLVPEPAGGAKTFPHLQALLDWQPDIVIEAASADAFSTLVPICLKAGVTVVAASVGAMQDPELLKSLAGICSGCDSRLIVPAGAVGGIDQIAAAALHPDTQVVYTSRKPRRHG